MVAFTPSPEMVSAVLTWRDLPLTDRIGKPLVPHLSRLFNLTPAEAVTVIRAAGSKEVSNAS